MHSGTLWNRIMTAQCEGMGEVGSARYEPALLPPCPSIRVLSYSNCQRSSHSMSRWMFRNWALLRVNLHGEHPCTVMRREPSIERAIHSSKRSHNFAVISLRVQEMILDVLCVRHYSSAHFSCRDEICYHWRHHETKLLQRKIRLTLHSVLSQELPQLCILQELLF